MVSHEDNNIQVNCRAAWVAEAPESGGFAGDENLSKLSMVPTDCGRA